MSTKIIPEALVWLNTAGVNITEEKFYIRSILLTFISVVLVVLEVLQIVYNFDIDTIAGVVEVLNPVYLALIKILMVVNHHETLSRINKNINCFWTTNKFNSQLGDKLETEFIIVKRLLFMYRWFALTTTTMIITLKPLFTGNGGLPVDIWQPIDLLVTPYYEITYFLESCVGYFASLVNIAIDSLYVGYILHIVAQCMLLKYAFKNLPMKQVVTYDDESICWAEMKKYIEYHNHILTVINDIQNSHSFTFLNVFVVGTLSVCIDLYSVALDNGSLDIIRLIKYTFQCSFFVFLLFVYCFTGNQIANQCLEVADAVYESEWYYSPLPRIRRGVMVVIQRTQKEITLNAGGLITLDLVNFIKMMRLAFSVFTLMRAQAENKKQ